MGQGHRGEQRKAAVGGSCGERRKIVEENGRITVVENLQSTLVEVPNSGGWGLGSEGTNGGKGDE